MPNKTMQTRPIAAIAAIPPKTPAKTIEKMDGCAETFLLLLFAINNIVYYLMSYDVAIIGGGIAGLYCALKLSPHLKIILFESNDYFGGRIKTNESPHFETGAGRVNEHHVLFCKLLHEYKLTLIPLSTHSDYIDKVEGPIPHADEYYEYLLKKSHPVILKKCEKLHFISTVSM